jgi:hypothetical protein
VAFVISELPRTDLELISHPTFRWAMTESSITLFPAMIKPLRLARRARDGLYHLGGNQPVCSMALARKMVEGGWLEQHGQRYEPTAQGLRAVE